MQRETCASSSALRPAQASAAELVAGGSQIAIPAQQPLRELTREPVKEYALSADPYEIDSEEAVLVAWAQINHRLFADGEIADFENRAGFPQTRQRDWRRGDGVIELERDDFSH